MDQIVVPQWFAVRLCELHGTLEAASQHYGVKILDDWLVQMQDQVNQDLHRKLGSNDRKIS